MIISFTVADDRVGARPCALVSARQLAAFRSFAAVEGERSGIAVIDRAAQDPAVDDFEARVCPFALAVLAAVFEHDETAIGVIEQAQFRGRLVRFGRDKEENHIYLWVSSTPDDAIRLKVSKASAYAILRALGVAQEPVGEIRADELRDRLSDPATRRRFADNHVDHYRAHLNVLAAMDEPDADARVVWA
ncbi:hypothetical protein [Sphingomonas sp. SUN039]|uniref:hypothetical protein n=1 Tax=Sphingomonas sp. SUN039 TaxID=2937787 RepID=UPI002164491B|nr:hypothetical protein [Sphingomonas sp. SUN039]UVO53723.1 hypothetical protein M0209_06160 [Sphingomonas sp. SUN039]